MINDFAYICFNFPHTSPSPSLLPFVYASNLRINILSACQNSTVNQPLAFRRKFFTVFTIFLNLSGVSVVAVTHKTSFFSHDGFPCRNKNTHTLARTPICKSINVKWNDFPRFCVEFGFECTGTGTWTGENFARTVEPTFICGEITCRCTYFRPITIFCNICQAKIKLSSFRESYFFVNELSQRRFERQKKT